jgi:hypothetical protein
MYRKRCANSALAAAAARDRNQFLDFAPRRLAIAGNGGEQLALMIAEQLPVRGFQNRQPRCPSGCSAEPAPSSRASHGNVYRQRACHSAACCRVR